MINKFVNASFKELGEFFQLLHQSSKMTQPKTQTLMPSHVQILLYTQHTVLYIVCRNNTNKIVIVK